MQFCEFLRVSDKSTSCKKCNREIWGQTYQIWLLICIFEKQRAEMLAGMQWSWFTAAGSMPSNHCSKETIYFLSPSAVCDITPKSENQTVWALSSGMTISRFRHSILLLHHTLYSRSYWRKHRLQCAYWLNCKIQASDWLTVLDLMMEWINLLEH